MGFITMFHHHLGDYFLGHFFPGNSRKFKISVIFETLPKSEEIQTAKGMKISRTSGDFLSPNQTS